MSNENQGERNKISIGLVISWEELQTNSIIPDEIKGELEQKPYYLLIFIPRKDVLKANCFPINEKDITKILIKIEEFSPNLVKGISTILKDLELSKDILHTTGLCFEMGDCYYESYMKTNALDSQMLENIKKNFIALDKVIEIKFEDVPISS